MTGGSPYAEHLARAAGAFLEYLNVVPTCCREGDQEQADRLGEIVQSEARAASEARTDQ